MSHLSDHGVGLDSASLLSLGGGGVLVRHQSSHRAAIPFDAHRLRASTREEDELRGSRGFLVSMTATTCRNCGQRNRPGSTDCARCRLPLDVTPDSVPRPVKGRRVWPLAVLVLVAGTGAAFWLTLTPSPSRQTFADLERASAETRSNAVSQSSAETALPVDSPTPAEPPEPIDPEPAVAPPTVADPPSAASAATGNTRTSSDLQRVIRSQSGAIRKCYEAGLARNPKLSGTVKVKFAIDGTGRVVLAASESSDLQDSSVTQCVVRVFRAMQFPPSGEGMTTVSYPVKLKPD